MRLWTALVVLAPTLTLLPTCRHPQSAGIRLTGRDAEPTGIAGFAWHDKFIEAQISPKGTYLAAIVNEGGRRSLVFIDLVKRQFSSRITPDSESMVGSYYWANDERVVVELVDQDGSLAKPVSRGELYAVNATGRDGRLVFGYRHGDREISWIRNRQNLGLGHRLPNDNKEVFVEAISVENREDSAIQLYRLNVYNGKKRFVGQTPLLATEVLADENGDPRIASGFDETLTQRFFYRAGAQGWIELTRLKGFTNQSAAIAFSSRDRTVYVSEQGEGIFGVYAVNIDSGDRRRLSKNDTVPPSSFVIDPATRRVLAVEYEPDLPVYDFLLPDHPLCRAMAGLLVAYPGHHVRLMNTTDDGKKAVFWAYSDRDPGQFLLVDVERFMAEPLVSVRPWIRSEQMSEVAALHIAASDGMKIHGYLTLPQSNHPGLPPPLVVLPHGGPHFVRDHWGFNPEVQLLAKEGFAVLQVNYRGSGGYGLKYEQAGYRNWDSRIVQDIIDATRYVIGKGLVDPRRVCIYGASFGAFAAMQSTILAPELFRCAVGYAGIYDLSLVPQRSDSSTSSFERGYMQMAVGADTPRLKNASPAYNADQIRARVLLIHGLQDNRAPLEHAEKLKGALTKAGQSPEWILEPREGHGFYDEDARERMYSRLLEFLKENTKEEPEVPGRPASMP